MIVKKNIKILQLQLGDLKTYYLPRVNNITVERCP